MAPGIAGRFFRRIGGDGVSGASVATVSLALLSVTAVSAEPLVYVFGRADFAPSNGGMLAAAGDFNGDGRPDLVAIDYQGSTVSILLGQQDGSFAEIAPSYAVGGQPTVAVAWDFNQDGNLDLAIAGPIAPGLDDGRPDSVGAGRVFARSSPVFALQIDRQLEGIAVGVQADEVAVAQEIVRMAARSDISEEVSRFRAHVLHWVTLSDSTESCGRKLDFLLQERNREVNTMGSKADGLQVSELIIAAKAELEKMRAQVQNVE